jgi:osmotically-inducible protein OsmY
MAERYDYDRERYGARWDEEKHGRGPGPGRDRGFFERAGDEVRSWFGDDEADRRRRMDEREGGGSYGSEYGRYQRSGYGREGYSSGGYGGGTSYSSYGSPWRNQDDQSGWGRERDTREGYTGGTPGGDFGRIYGSRGYGYGYSGASYGGETNRDYWGSRGAGQRQTGPYVGKGPSGYRRSDERIREDINDRLTEHPYIDATHINVTVKNGEVTLDGSVESREMKRMAEDCAEWVSGVSDVQNHIRVTHDISTGPDTGKHLAT